MKKEFQMSKEQLQIILDASKPVRYMGYGSMEPSSPQENSNRAWQNLANELGFDLYSVEPVNGKGNDFFMATPTT